MSRPKRSARAPSLARVLGTGVKWFVGTLGALAGTAAVASAALRYLTKSSAAPPQPEPTPPPAHVEEPEHPAGEEEVRYPDGRIEHPSVSYEPRDVKFGWVMAFLAGALCVLVIHYFAVWKFFGSQKAAISELRRSPYPLAPIPSTRLPPPPRLEQLDRMERIAATNVYERQAAREQILNSYGTTGEKGFARIPIDEAMKLVADELPVRKDPSPQQHTDRGLRDAGEPNSGRMFRIPAGGEDQ